MKHDRRTLLTGLALAPALFPQTPRGDESAPSARLPLIRPPRLRPGDKVGLVNPATAAFDPISIDIARDTLRALGLVPVLSEHYFDRRGYFAGADEVRAADLMRFFLDPEIKGIWARGGWGSARVLPHLDYGAIASNPKVLVGYSDSTALLSGIHRKTGLVVFHGPFPKSTFTAEHQRALLFDGATPTLANPAEANSDRTVVTEHRTRILRPGTATGPLLGGNLTVLTSIVGTPFLTNLEGAILFIEDVDEAIYRIDRMLTQLALAGHLREIAGVVFGRCTDCPTGSTPGSLTLEDVLVDHLVPLEIPVYRGAMIGHIQDQFTLPLGIETRLDASAATLELMAPAVR